MIEAETDLRAWKGKTEWVQEALKRLRQHPEIQKLTKKPLRLSIAILPNAQMQTLNQRYRNKSTIPNVLSFAYDSDSGFSTGEVLLSYPFVSEEAKRLGKRASQHARDLLVHGALHVLGFDHELETDAIVMEKLEDEILNRPRS